MTKNNEPSEVFSRSFSMPNSESLSRNLHCLRNTEPETTDPTPKARISLADAPQRKQGLFLRITLHIPISPQCPFLCPSSFPFDSTLSTQNTLYMPVGKLRLQPGSRASKEDSKNSTASESRLNTFELQGFRV